MAVYSNTKSADISQGLLVLPLYPRLDVHQVLEDVPLQNRARSQDPRVGGTGDPGAESIQGVETS